MYHFKFNLGVTFGLSSARLFYSTTFDTYFPITQIYGSLQHIIVCTFTELSYLH